MNVVPSYHESSNDDSPPPGRKWIDPSGDLCGLAYPAICEFSKEVDGLNSQISHHIREIQGLVGSYPVIPAIQQRLDTLNGRLIYLAGQCEKSNSEQQALCETVAANLKDAALRLQELKKLKGQQN